VVKNLTTEDTEFHGGRERLVTKNSVLLREKLRVTPWFFFFFFLQRDYSGKEEEEFLTTDRHRPTRTKAKELKQ
jgi:hypothetical protein